MSRYKDSKSLRKELVKTNNIFESLKFVRVIAISLLVFIIIVTALVRVTTISGSSMYPTLQDGEIALTNVLGKYIGNYDRFDIVTVYSEEEQLYLAKRVIALPNETVEYQDDKLYINGEYVKEGYLDEAYIEEQTNFNSIAFTSDFGPITLKDNEYFLMGDNRRVSLDSRRYGPYRKSDIVSKGVFVFFGK